MSCFEKTSPTPMLPLRQNCRIALRDSTTLEWRTCVLADGSTIVQVQEIRIESAYWLTSSGTDRKQVEKVGSQGLLSLAKILVISQASSPEDELLQTSVTQPAIFLHAVVDALTKEEFDPLAVAGHSLGEFSALVASKVLSFEDGLRLVQVRANAMQKVSMSLAFSAYHNSAARKMNTPLVIQACDSV